MSCRCVSIVLCLAPMALMVGAAENGGVNLAYTAYCGHDPNYFTMYTDQAANCYILEIIGTSSICCYVHYTGCPYECNICHESGTTSYKDYLKTHSYRQSEVNGNYICHRCNYVRPNN